MMTLIDGCNCGFCALERIRSKAIAQIVPPEARQTFEVEWVSASETVVAKTGHNCAKCNSRNDYATSNRPDGTYVCFECR